MPLTAKTVVLAARDRHPAFHRKRHPDPVLVRFLDRFQDRLISEIAQRMSTAVVDSFEIVTSEHDFEAGDPISDFLEEEPPERMPVLISGAFIEHPTGNVGVPVVEDPRVAERATTHTVLWHGDRLRLVGGASAWRGIDGVTIEYFPRPPSVTTLDSPIGLPGEPAALLEAACAAFLAGRSKQEDGVPVGEIGGMLREERRSYMDDVTGRLRVERYIVPDTLP